MSSPDAAGAVRSSPRLGMWTRLGVAASLAWVVGVLALFAAERHAVIGDWAELMARSCADAVRLRLKAEASCGSAYRDAYLRWAGEDLVSKGPRTLFLALAPIPLAWLAVWGAVATTRWVLRGRG